MFFGFLYVVFILFRDFRGEKIRERKNSCLDVPFVEFNKFLLPIKKREKEIKSVGENIGERRLEEKKIWKVGEKNDDLGFI